MTILIQNGQVINPATGMNEVADVLVENGVVSKIEKGIKEKADRKINAKGCFVMPGFIDMHVHLRDPGFEEKETIETGCGQQHTVDIQRFLQCRTPSRSLTILMW